MVFATRKASNKNIIAPSTHTQKPPAVEVFLFGGVILAFARTFFQQKLKD